MSGSLESLIADAVPVTQVPKHVPGRPNKSTVWRWCTRGVRGERLETFFSGGRRMTSKAMIADFMQRLNAGLADSQGERDSADADFQRRAKAAGKVLEAQGC